MNIIYCMSREVTTEEEQTQLLFLVRSAQMTDYFTLRYVSFRSLLLSRYRKLSYDRSIAQLSFIQHEGPVALVVNSKVCEG
jgi:hypothetical protein